MMEFFAPSPAPTSADDTAITPLERRVRNKASTAMVVATPVKKPYWENLDGFPNTTIQLEQRRLNPFLDINSFASKGHEYNVGARPIDTKGELGNGPVQRWKEMLREGMAYRPSKFAPTFNLKLYEGRRAQELAADGHFIKQLGHLAGGKDYSLKQGTRALTCTLSANQRHNIIPLSLHPSLTPFLYFIRVHFLNRRPRVCRVPREFLRQAGPTGRGRVEPRGQAQWWGADALSL